MCIRDRVRDVGEDFGAKFVAVAVRKILTEAEPELVPPAVSTGLLTLTKDLVLPPDAPHPSHEALVDVVVRCGEALDEMPRTNFVVLGELCAVLRDATNPAARDAAALLVGPALLARKDRSGSRPDAVDDASNLMRASGMSAAHDADAAAAADATRAMRVLITHSDVLFGRSAMRLLAPGAVALGARTTGAAAAALALSASVASNATTTTTTRPPPLTTTLTTAVQNSASTPASPASSNPTANANATTKGRRTMLQNNSTTANAHRRRSTMPSEMTAKDAAQVSKKNALRTFFTWRDERMVACVEALFANHRFPDIAKAVQQRYNMLPPGWRSELDELAKRSPGEFAWYLEPSSTALSTTTATTPATPTSTVPKPVAGTHARELTNVSNVIDEILDTELSYYETLHEVQTRFVSKLRNIASGREGHDALAALGISMPEIENVFGWRLAQVVQTSSYLLQKLEVVELVRGETLNPGGRAFHVALAFEEIGNELSVNYAPFISGHQSSMQVLNRGTAALSDSRAGGSGANAGGAGSPSGAKSGGGRFGVSSVRMTVSFSRLSSRLLVPPTSPTTGGVGGGGAGDPTASGGDTDIVPGSLGAAGGPTHGAHGANSANGAPDAGAASSSALANATTTKSFQALWQHVSSSSARLRGQSLQSVMIMPIQRVPRYVLLLKELDKRLTELHPAKSHLRAALAQITLVASEINEALRRHEKLTKLVGESDMPEITGAKMGKEGRLTVSYGASGGGGASRRR